MEKTILIGTVFLVFSLLLVVHLYYFEENLEKNNINYNKTIERLNYNINLLNSYSLYLKYEKIINYEKYLKYTNLKKITLENYGDIDIDYKTTNIYLININNPISFELIYNIVKDIPIRYSLSGNSNFPDGEIIYSEYINNLNMHMDKYIFDTSINSKLENIQMIYDVIPLPKNPPINNSIALYSGQAYTGTHFHAHENAYNYLMKGKKIWMIMNDTIDLNNNIYLKPVDWFIETIEYYSKNPNVSIFIQNEGEVVFVPSGKYHFALNLEPSYGLFYESREFENNLVK
jgi:hypothetical protein